MISGIVDFSTRNRFIVLTLVAPKFARQSGVLRCADDAGKNAGVPTWRSALRSAGILACRAATFLSPQVFVFRCGRQAMVIPAGNGDFPVAGC
jgi:hypothetical protein